MITNPFQGKAYDAVFVPMRTSPRSSPRREQTRSIETNAHVDSFALSPAMSLGPL